MKASCVPILGILGHAIVNWHTKNIKKWQLLAWKFFNLPITQKPLGVQSWNLDTIWMLINGLCNPSLGTPSHETKILQAEDGQYVDEFEPIYFSKYQFWLKMICDFEHTINCLSFGHVCLPQPEYHFFSFFSYFFFSFFLLFFGYLLLNY